MKQFSILIIIILLFSCTKEIQINIPNQGAEFVVNGYIENGQHAKVLLTRSLPYFDPLNDDIVFASFINDATVTLKSSLGEIEELEYNSIPGFTDTWYYNLPFDDGCSFHGLCFTMGTNEFLGSNRYYKFI